MTEFGMHMRDAAAAYAAARACVESDDLVYAAEYAGDAIKAANRALRTLPREQRTIRPFDRGLNLHPYDCELLASKLRRAVLDCANTATAYARGRIARNVFDDCYARMRAVAHLYP